MTDSSRSILKKQADVIYATKPYLIFKYPILKSKISYWRKTSTDQIL